MKKLGAVFGSIFLFVLVFYAGSDSVLADAVSNWNDNLGVVSGETLTPPEVQRRYDCIYKNAQSISLKQPFTYLFQKIPVIINPTYTDLGVRCTISSQAGVFTSRLILAGNDNQTYSEYFGPSTSKMYSLYPTFSGNIWVDPVPESNKVLVLGRDPGTKIYSVTVHEGFDRGQPEISQSVLTLNFKNSLARTVRDINNGIFKIDEHAFSPNGKYMTIRYKQTVSVVNLSTMQMTPVAYESGSPAEELAVSNDGRYVALLGAKLLIVDAKDCQLTYGASEWDYNFNKAVYDGCNTSNDVLDKLQDDGLIQNNARLKRPHFDSDNRSLLVAVGMRRTDVSPAITGVSAFNWQHKKITAQNHVSQTQGYLALGDSFSSGEGDLQGGDWYEPGTDDQGNKNTFENRNLCHISRRSYPYLIAKELDYLSGEPETPTTPDDSGLFHSVACSGAVIHNVVGGIDKLVLGNGTEDKFKLSDNQYNNAYLSDLGRWQPGRLKQLDALESSVFGGYSSNESKPEIITIGIGGNDAGFGDSIKACAMPGTCKRAIEGSDDASNIAIGIMRLKPKLIETYKSIRTSSPDSRVYVHGYPIFVSDRVGETTDLLEGGTCRLNVRLDYNERRLVVEGVKYMNKVIQAAAKEAGVIYVDIENILYGVNLCSGAELSDYAVNGVTAGNDIDFKFCVFRTGCLGKEMFHPNPKAHVLYAKRVVQNTLNFSKPMPEPSMSTVPTPDSFFGNKALYEAISINSGDENSIVIPESKPFLNSTINGYKILQSGLLPGSTLQVELQSTPKKIGEFIVPESGVVDQFVQLPNDAEPGVHEVHIFGTTSLGQDVDYYEQIMVAAHELDFDGDSILNAEDSCQTIPNSLTDEDADGIDDACDGEIMPNNQLELPQEQDAVPVEPVIDDGREKGQPNPETVAGNEQTNVQSVLGASTSTEAGQVLADSSELSKTGVAAIIASIVGGCLITAALLLNLKKVYQD